MQKIKTSMRTFLPPSFCMNYSAFNICIGLSIAINTKRKES